VPRALFRFLAARAVAAPTALQVRTALLAQLTSDVCACVCVPARAVRSNIDSLWRAVMWRCVRWFVSLGAGKSACTECMAGYTLNQWRDCVPCWPRGQSKLLWGLLISLGISLCIVVVWTVHSQILAVLSTSSLLRPLACNAIARGVMATRVPFLDCAVISVPYIQLMGVTSRVVLFNSPVSSPGIPELLFGLLDSLRFALGNDWSASPQLWVRCASRRMCCIGLLQRSVTYADLYDGSCSRAALAMIVPCVVCVVCVLCSSALCEREPAGCDDGVGLALRHRACDGDAAGPRVGPRALLLRLQGRSASRLAVVPRIQHGQRVDVRRPGPQWHRGVCMFACVFVLVCVPGRVPVLSLSLFAAFLSFSRSCSCMHAPLR
jgi:hypothetical protein